MKKIKVTDPVFDQFLRSAKAIEDEQLLQNIKTSTLEEISAEITVDPAMLAGVRAWIEAKKLDSQPLITPEKPLIK
jgi:hypothetical protein